MAAANTQLRWASLIKGAFGLKGGDSGRLISPVIQPSFETADPEYRPEDRAMRGERLFYIGTSVSQVSAASFGLPNLTNLASSNVLLVLRRVRWSGTLPTNVVQPGRLWARVEEVNNNGGVATFSIAKDFRSQQQNLPMRCGLGTVDSTGAVTTAILSASNTLWAQEVFVATAASGFLVDSNPIEIVLPPGTGVRCGLVGDTLPTGNWNFTLTYEGYERVIDPAERILPP